MSSVESFANEHADNVLNPLQVTTALSPVLATPAYAAYAGVAGLAFTAGLISDAVESHHAAEAKPAGPVPNNGSVGQLLGMRVDAIN